MRRTTPSELIIDEIGLIIENAEKSVTHAGAYPA
jgi:hypothetical protein